MCGAVLFSCLTMLMRLLHIVFKLMFSILTLLWLFGFHGPHTGVLSGKPQVPIKGIFSSASTSTDESVSLFFVFVSIIWEGDMLACVIMQKILFSLGTKLHRSKHKHVITSFSSF